MNLEFTADEQAFRAEVRAFIDQNYPDSLRRAQRESRQLTRAEQ